MKSVFTITYKYCGYENIPPIFRVWAPSVREHYECLLPFTFVENGYLYTVKHKMNIITKYCWLTKIGARYK